MSFFPAQDPQPGDARSCDAVELVIVPRTSDIGNLEVRRALPNAKRRMVGPFVFLDEMGPAEFRTGQGVDVRPHPHIGLATVTYLFEGEIMHRDSLGTHAPIRPEEVNWMTAGGGIVHSERTGADRRQGGERLHGLQCWVALPLSEEEGAPGFVHHAASDLPVVSGEGKTVRVVAGELYGARSPVATSWQTLFADARIEAGAALPLDAGYEERALYVVEGEVAIAGDRFASGRLLVFRPGDRLEVKALSDCRVVVLGGAAMDGPRYVWWNFVSSNRERIEQAKAEWKEGRFSAVPARPSSSRCLSADRTRAVEVRLMGSFQRTCTHCGSWAKTAIIS